MIGAPGPMPGFGTDHSATCPCDSCAAGPCCEKAEDGLPCECNGPLDKYDAQGIDTWADLAEARMGEWE